MGDITEQELALTLGAVTTAPDVATVGEPAGGLGVSRAVMGTSAVRFEACREGVANIELGPRVYELARDPAPSETITTAVSDFCGLHVDVSSWGDPINASLRVESTDAAGDAQDFSSERELSLAFTTDLEHSFGEQPLLLGIDLSQWLEGLPAEDEASSTERLEAQLQAAAALYVDANGNGKLDDDEATPLLRSEP